MDMAFGGCITGQGGIVARDHTEASKFRNLSERN